MRMHNIFRCSLYKERKKKQLSIKIHTLLSFIFGCNVSNMKTHLSGKIYDSNLQGGGDRYRPECHGQ